MSTCIYCRRSQQERFPREHVIPKSLGTFHSSLTVGCVCRDCNQHFGKHLELRLARESVESVVRLQYGIRGNTAAPKSRVTARINVPGPMFGAKVVLGSNAAGNGIEITYLPQVDIQSKGSEEWNWYLEEDLVPTLLQEVWPGGFKNFLTSQAELERLRSRLRALGLPATQVVRHDRIPPQTQLKARVTFQFYSNLARSVAKIAFNYLAYTMHEDTNFLLCKDFDAIRNYVRHDINPGQGFVYFSGSPRLDPAERKGSAGDGHILVVGWDAANEGIICNLSLFNAMAYRLTLSRKYSGVWFPFGNAHSFDCRRRKVKREPFGIWTP